jgi:hypothetical protein
MMNTPFNCLVISYWLFVIPYSLLVILFSLLIILLPVLGALLRFRLKKIRYQGGLITDFDERALKIIALSGPVVCF